MPVNCSERKKPPTSSTAIITAERRRAAEDRAGGDREPPRSGVGDQDAAEAEAARIRGAKIFMTIAPTPPANVISPDWNGDQPKPSCSISGSRNGMAPTPIRNTKPPTTLARNVGIRSSAKSSTGAGVRRA